MEGGTVITGSDDESFLQHYFLELGKGEKVVFADMCVKYDRSFKPTNRELILTETALFFLGAEKEKNGPNKGKFVKVVKRKIPFSEIQSVSLR